MAKPDVFTVGEFIADVLARSHLNPITASLCGEASQNGG